MDIDDANERPTLPCPDLDPHVLSFDPQTEFFFSSKPRLRGAPAVDSLVHTSDEVVVSDRTTLCRTVNGTGASSP